VILVFIYFLHAANFDYSSLGHGMIVGIVSVGWRPSNHGAGTGFRCGFFLFSCEHRKPSFLVPDKD
jgi:hypothetical protein